MQRAVLRPVTRRSLAVLLAFVLAASTAVALAPSADAVVIAVTRTDDPAPGTPGQCGSPASDSSDDCSLRQAVRRANATAADDVLVLGAETYTLSQEGDGEDAAATGDLDVVGSLSVVGAGVGSTTITWVDIATADRIFHVLEASGGLELQDLTLTGGFADSDGGAVLVDGGQLDVARSRLLGNETMFGRGGAIASTDADVRVAFSTLDGNRAPQSYGGAVSHFASDATGPVTASLEVLDSVLSANEGNRGGAIHVEAEVASTANLLVQRSVLADNDSIGCCGGAIVADDALLGSGGSDARTNVVVVDSELTGNHAVNCCGGAIYAEGTSGTPEPTVTVTLDSSTLDGNSSEGDPSMTNGCCGGGLYGDHIDVVAVDTSFDGNVDNNCCGGGVYLFDSTGEFVRVTVNDNRVVDPDGACCGGGVAIYTGSVVTFQDSEISRNEVGNGCCGGAVEIADSEVTFWRTTIADNVSEGCCGGGIEMGSSSTVRVIDSTISGNVESTGFPIGGGDDSHRHGGGAIVAYGNGDELLVENSTISGNSTVETGGGIAMIRGSATIVHSTITGNTGGLGGSAIAAGDTGSAGVGSATVAIVNSIVDGTCAVETDTSAIVSGGGNVGTDASCALGDPSDQVVSDAGLRPLADNGGPTLTHALVPSSPALDAGTAATVDPVQFDQRGAPRPEEGDGVDPAEADAGAVEMSFADLSVEKSVDDDAPTVGDEVEYTIEVTNDGPATSYPVVTDDLPAGVTFVAASAGCTEAAGTVTCDLGELVAGATASAVVTVSVDDEGTITNTATVASAGLDEDRDPSNDSASATLDAQAAPDPDPEPGLEPLPGGVERLSGGTRVETAVAISQQTFADGAAGAVVLARSDLYPDALAGTPLAVQERAPLLLTPPNELVGVTADEIERVLPDGGTVHLLGGLVALDQSVEDAVEALGYDVVRYAGGDRYDTATLIADDGLDGFGDVFLVTGTNYPDAVASGAAAAATDGAILLTAGSTMVDATREALDDLPASSTVYAVGGPSAAAQDGDVDLIGDTRIETALLVAERFFDDPPVAGVATGFNFPDALTGGAQVGAYGGPMLLTDGATLDDGVGDYLETLPDDATVFLYGGPNALSLSVENAVRDRVR